MELKFSEVILSSKSSSNPLNISTISYSLLNSLKCPIRYYVTNIIKYHSFNEYTLIGSIVHYCYEKQINEILNNNYKNIFTFYDKRFFERSFRYYLSQYNGKTLDLATIENIMNKKYEIYQAVKRNLNKWFIINLIKYKKKGYKIVTEDKQKFTTVKFLDNNIVLYSKPDIVIIKDNEIIVIDIKIGKFSYMYKTQLLIYCYNMLFSIKYNKPVYTGQVFLTRENSIRELFKTNKEFIKKIIDKYFIDLTYLYKSLNITDLESLETFVKSINKLDNNKISLIYDFFKFIHGKKLCSFCPIFSICPLRNRNQNILFDKLINSLSNTERIIFVNKLNKNKENIII